MSHKLLAVDRQVSSFLRVRVWENQGASTRFDRPAGHDEVEVTWVEKGALRYKVGQRVQEVPPGAAIVLPPYVEHATLFQEQTCVGSVRLGPQMLDKVAEAMGQAFKKKGFAPGIIPDAAKIAALGKMLESEIAQEAPGKLLILDALAEALAVEVLRRGETRTTSRPWIKDPRMLKVLECIDASAHQVHTLEDLASIACLSRFHFSRLFREQIGISPYRYLLQVRLERVAALIKRGHCSTGEAALSMGFNDLGRFARMFRKHFGCNPSEYQRLADAREIAKGNCCRARSTD